MDNTQDSSQVPEQSNDYSPAFLIRWFLIPGLIQGFAHYWLFLSDQDIIEHDGLLLALGLFAFLFPAVIYLSVEKTQQWQPVVFGFALALLCAVLAYLSYQNFALPESFVEPGYGRIDKSWPYVSSIAASFVIAVVAIPFFRTATQRQSGFTHYPSLFEFAWQQFVVACFSLLFLLLVLGVLRLATSLLGAVGADFMEPIWEPEILAPLAFASAALGAGITRQQPQIIKSASQLFLGLLNVVQPLHLLLTVIFLVYVISTKFQSLNDSRLISSILMFTVALGLSLCTAAVGFEKKQKQGLFSQLWKFMALATLLVSLLSLWLVWRRLDNFGPTHLYLVVSLLLFVGFVHAVGYCVAFFTKSNAEQVVGKTNVIGALLALAIAILVQLPMFNLVNYSVSTQVDRINAKGDPVDIHKLRWMQRMAGRPGNDAIDKFYSDAVLALPVRSEFYTRRWNQQTTETPQQQLAPLYASNHFKLLSPHYELTDGQRNNLEVYLTRVSHQFKAFCLKEINVCRVYIATELEEDGSLAMLAIRKRDILIIEWASRNEQDSWSNREYKLDYLRSVSISATDANVKAFFDSLDRGELPVTSVTLPVVQIGEELINPIVGEIK